MSEIMKAIHDVADQLRELRDVLGLRDQLGKAAHRGGKTHASERFQVEKRQTRYSYAQGPVYFLGQQIVKVMEDGGFPAKIAECLRTPERQDMLFVQGRSKAKRWQSPHQYALAVDIIHPERGWNVSEEYWEALASAVRVVEAKFKVNLEHGHYWDFRDSAHVQLAAWKKHADRIGHAVPMQSDLERWFAEVLPGPWKQHLRSSAKAGKATAKSLHQDEFG